MSNNIFEVLSEPHRRSMLDLLRIRERSVGELVDKCQLSQPGVSKHLRVLREAGLVEVRSVSQKTSIPYAQSRFKKSISGWSHIVISGPASLTISSPSLIKRKNRYLIRTYIDHDKVRRLSWLFLCYTIDEDRDSKIDFY